MTPKVKIDFVPFLILMLAASGSASAERVVESELHEHITEAFVNPAQSSSVPRVLIIGDSISIGYTDVVRNNLKGVADVFRPPVNCQHTGHGLKHIGAWLGTDKWDVIHFNFGIWDTHLLDAQGKLFARMAEDKNSPTGDIRVRHTPEQYRENLTKLTEILQKTGAKLIWASTTPIMYRQGDRFNAIPELNRVAAEIMTVHGVAINDLYEFVLPHVKEWQNTDQAHFNARGNQQLGKKVADCILRALATAK